jgi:transcriptional regulator with XRE-family HTH domain
LYSITKAKRSLKLPKSIHEIDRVVGKKLRLARLAAGVSQTQLAEVLDVTFQQVQKYEKGTNRLSSSKLYACSRYLNVDIGYFFSDIEESTIAEIQAGSANGAQDFSKPDFQVIRSLSKIKDRRVQNKLRALIHAVADAELVVED